MVRSPPFIYLQTMCNQIFLNLSHFDNCSLGIQSNRLNYIILANTVHVCYKHKDNDNNVFINYDFFPLGTLAVMFHFTSLARSSNGTGERGGLVVEPRTQE